MFGAHIHKGNHKSYQAALDDKMELMKSHNVECQSAQLFVMGPQNSNPNFTESSAGEFGRYAAEHNVKIIVHNSYLVSLWNKNLSKRPFARFKIKEQLLLCDAMNAAGFIIHLPNLDVDEIYEELRHCLFTDGSAISKFKTPIFMEIEATKSSIFSYEKTSRIDALFSKIPADLIDKIGLCIDTAHVWSADYSFADKEAVIKWFNELSYAGGGILWKPLTHGLSRLIFHLNDADNDRGSGKDVHAQLGLGKMWSTQQSGLIEIVRFIAKSNLIAILERNKTDIEHDCDVINTILHPRKTGETSSQ